MKLDIPAQNVLIMGGVAAYRLIMERWPRDIRLNVNSMTSDWFDLEDSIAEKTIKVTLASGICLLEWMVGNSLTLMDHILSF